MAVSAEVREFVIDRANGHCQLFHNMPFPGAQVCHMKQHQGFGGMPPEHWVNQPDNLLLGCAQCHRKLHDPHDPFIVEEFDYDGRIIKIRTPSGRLISPKNTPIWFLLEDDFVEAQAHRVLLESASRQYRDAQSRLMQEFLYFRDVANSYKVKPFRRWMVFNDEGGSTVSGWEDVPKHVGFTVGDADRLELTGRWLEQEGLTELAQDIDFKLLEVIRLKAKDHFSFLAGIARDGSQDEFWDALDRLTKTADELRPFWVGTGKVRRVLATGKDVVLKKLMPGEFLLRGSMLAGRDNVIRESLPKPIEPTEPTDDRLPDGEFN